MSDESGVGDLVGWCILVGVLLLVPAWRIHKRAGLQPSLSLLIFVPYIGVLVSGLVLALSKWPAIERHPAVKSAE
jgi:hypothetical protein